MWIYVRYIERLMYISRILEQISMRIAEKSPPYLKLLTTECCGAGSADDLSFNWPQDSAYLCHGKNHHFHTKTVRSLPCDLMSCFLNSCCTHTHMHDQVSVLFFESSVIYSKSLFEPEPNHWSLRHRAGLFCTQTITAFRQLPP